MCVERGCSGGWRGSWKTRQRHVSTTALHTRGHLARQATHRLLVLVPMGKALAGYLIPHPPGTGVSEVVRNDLKACLLAAEDQDIFPEGLQSPLQAAVSAETINN